MTSLALRARIRPHARAAAKLLVGKRLWARLRAARILANPTECELPIAVEIASRLGPGIAVDIGANNGMYAIPLATRVDLLVAFDANPAMCAFLRSELPRAAIVENLALSDSDGELVLRIPVMRGAEIAGMGTVSAANTFDNFDVERTVQIPVRATTLDEYVSARLPQHAVTFIKIDVEGAEEHVLLGASKLLVKYSPVLLVETELRHGADVHAIFSGLSNLGYHAFRFDVLSKRLSSVHVDNISDLQSSDRLQHRPEAERYVNNFFFIPATKLGRLTDLIA